ncbi:hypothetical protein C3L33_08842, partial [Rhododendron williamsianum]
MKAGLQRREAEKGWVADWVSRNYNAVRSLPIYMVGISLLVVLINCGVSGIADASRGEACGYLGPWIRVLGNCVFWVLLHCFLSLGVLRLQVLRLRVRGPSSLVRRCNYSDFSAEMVLPLPQGDREDREHPRLRQYILQPRLGPVLPLLPLSLTSPPTKNSSTSGAVQRRWPHAGHCRLLSRRGRGHHHQLVLSQSGSIPLVTFAVTFKPYIETRFVLGQAQGQAKEWVQTAQSTANKACSKAAVSKDEAQQEKKQSAGIIQQFSFLKTAINGDGFCFTLLISGHSNLSTL